MDWDFDLFGDAIPVGHTGRGRPPHVPSTESRQKCVLLAAVGKSPDQIASALSITAKTLRKHYSRELREHDAARLKLEGKLLVALVREIDKGNVSANKEMAKRLERAGLEQLAEKYSGRKGERKAAPLGKKEQARQAAIEVTGKFAPPPGPLLN